MEPECPGLDANQMGQRKDQLEILLDSQGSTADVG